MESSVVENVIVRIYYVTMCMDAVPSRVHVSQMVLPNIDMINVSFFALNSYHTLNKHKNIRGSLITCTVSNDWVGIFSKNGVKELTKIHDFSVMRITYIHFQLPNKIYKPIFFSLS